MNKQIEEIAKHCCFPCEMECNGECIERKNPCECYIALTTAEELYNAGYRRQDEVAREIFTQLEEEIEPLLEKNYRLYTKYLNEQDSQTVLRFGGKIDALRGIYCFIEDLKKKYGVTEE